LFSVLFWIMNLPRPLILASSSPRRQMLLREIGFKFSVVPSHADESFPGDMDAMKVPALLAARKASVIAEDHPDAIVLASDTIVILDGDILNKPVDRSDAIRMLGLLSGATHTVVTAVDICSGGKHLAFDDVTRVTFKALTRAAIERYVDNFSPLDKAGAYGAQECLPTHFNPCSREEQEFLESIGRNDLVSKSMNHDQKADRLDAIARLEGSYFTVMGLPIHLVYRHMTAFRA
jgi:septum formation protein